jgi:outer membrane protein assembly factor BamB
MGMARWLVTLALFMVTNPADADAVRVQLDAKKTTTTTTPLPRLCEPRLAALPPSVELVDDAILVKTSTERIRHAIAHGGAGAQYLVPVGSRLVVGVADRAHDRADTLLAIDLATGALVWRRGLDSRFAAPLAGDLLAVERDGALDVIDARTGKTIATTPIAGHGIQSVSRDRSGDLYVKTRGDLVALAPNGAVRWVRPSSALGNVAVTERAVVDGWVDRVNHRFGIVSYDPIDGREVGTTDLGRTGGWYDFERLLLAPDGPNEVVVSSLFAVE